MIRRLFRADRPVAKVEARWGGPPSQFVAVGGLRTHYRDRGDPRGTEPALLLLHGSYASLHAWEGWGDALPSRRRVVALDLPGHGLTGPDPRRRYSPAAMADFVAAFASALELETVAVAGNSMGGRVAAEVALRHPERVRALVLIDAAGLRLEPPAPLRLRFFECRAADRLARWITPRSALRRSLREAWGNPAGVTERLVDRCEDMILRLWNRGAARAALRQEGQEAFEARLPRIVAPTLIMWGARDRWIPVSNARRFHERIRGSKVVIFEELGHVPMEEDPVRTAVEALRFLESSS